LKNETLPRDQEKALGGGELIIPRTSLFASFLSSLVLLIGFAVLYWIPDEELEEQLRHQIQVQQLAGEIGRLDEVLTMSARMAAATGDPKWEDRYRRHEEDLQAAIQDIIRLARSAIMDNASAATFSANEALIGMEHEVFELVRSGDLQSASAIIGSETYETQKKMYGSSTGKIARALRDDLHANLERHQQRDFLVFVFFALALFFTAVFWFSLLSHSRKRDRV
jgi:hypothetical protein